MIIESRRSPAQTSTLTIALHQIYYDNIIGLPLRAEITSPVVLSRLSRLLPYCATHWGMLPDVNSPKPPTGTCQFVRCSELFWLDVYSRWKPAKLLLLCTSIIGAMHIVNYRVIWNLPDLSEQDCCAITWDATRRNDTAQRNFLHFDHENYPSFQSFKYGSVRYSNCIISIWQQRRMDYNY